MGEHTEKKFIYLSQKLGRNTHPERKDVGNLSNEEELIQIPYIGQSFRVFVYLWPIISFLFPHLTCSRTLPNMRAQLFAKMDPTAKDCGCMSTLMGWCALPF